MPTRLTDLTAASIEGALAAAVRGMTRFVSGRPQAPASAAPHERSVLALASVPGGLESTSGDEPSRSFATPPSSARALAGVRVVMPSRGRPDGSFADRDVVLVVADDADAIRGDLPDELGGVPVECSSIAELEAGDRGPVSQGRKIAPAVASDRFGTVTRAFSRAGCNWVMTCSHVAAPAGTEGGKVVFETGVGIIEHLTGVPSAGGGCSIDVAIASTRSPVDERWPDGRPFEGVVAPESAVGPFAFFGIQNSGASFNDFEPEAPVDIHLASGATIRFSGQHRFVLDGASVEHGDSGGAVRDASDRLVGLVVGRDATGAGYFTPFERVDAWLDSLDL